MFVNIRGMTGSKTKEVTWVGADNMLGLKSLLGRCFLLNDLRAIAEFEQRTDIIWLTFKITILASLAKERKQKHQGTKVKEETA